MWKGTDVDTVLCAWEDFALRSCHNAEKKNQYQLWHKVCGNRNFTQLSGVLINSIIFSKILGSEAEVKSHLFQQYLRKSRDLFEQPGCASWFCMSQSHIFLWFLSIRENLMLVSWDGKSSARFNCYMLILLMKALSWWHCHCVILWL